VTARKLTICIFSFNRGRFLKNCVDSIIACIPDADIVVFDDDSNDPETVEYLQNASASFEVVGPREAGKIKHGGLYHNMNTALELLGDRPTLCFLQDDTQVVRPVSPTELEAIRVAFDENPKLGFIHPCFIRGIDLTKRKVVPLDGPSPELFFRQDTGQSTGIHYSDLIVFDPRRLLYAGWSFLQSEPANNEQARNLFGMMAYMWRPFAMWLPEVPAYRGKNKTLGLRLAERKKQVGFYPFNLMTADEVRAMPENGSDRLPIAEKYLDCHPHSPGKPWTYNPLSGLRLLKQLNNIEVAFRRWIKR
jgi:glycosyltransferase involved in cell wall biosynthesis